MTNSNQVPKLPDFISLFHEQLENVWGVDFLHSWDSIIFSIMIASLTSLVFYFGIRKPKIIPSGLQNFLEMSADLLKSLVHEIIGPQGEKYIPFIGTIFFYTLAMNLVGLIPMMESPSANLSITAAQAICVFVLVQYLNIKNMGLFGFFYHLAGSPKGAIGWVMAPLMFPIELITQLSRPITLAFRLFGNILGGDILIAYFTLMGILGVFFVVPFMCLEVLAGVIQALVFTLLSTVYISLSIPERSH